MYMFKPQENLRTLGKRAFMKIETHCPIESWKYSTWIIELNNSNQAYNLYSSLLRRWETSMAKITNNIHTTRTKYLCAYNVCENRRCTHNVFKDVWKGWVHAFGRGCLATLAICNAMAEIGTRGRGVVSGIPLKGWFIQIAPHEYSI